MLLAEDFMLVAEVQS